MLLGLTVAFVTVSAQNGGEAGMGIVMGISALAYGIYAGGFWEMVFSMVATINALGWDTILQGLGMVGTTPATPEAAETLQSTQTPSSGTALGNTEEGIMVLGGLAMFAVPILSGLGHLFFMLSPSQLGDSLYGQAEKPAERGGIKTVKSDNPFAGYAHLFEKSEEQKQADRIRAKAEIKELYQNRVLGGGQNG